MEPESKTITLQVLGNDTFIVKPDPAELCRLCANTDNQLIPIFKGEGLEHNIPSKLEKHLPIVKITETDKLPLQVCYQCASTLIAWHNLYEGCSVADKRLREILAVDEKLYHDEETFEDYGDDFRDDDFDQPHADFVQLNTASTSSQSGLGPNTSISEITQLGSSNTFDETENNNLADERCVARASRKRGPLTTACGMPSFTGEERAKMVKSKKARLPAAEAAQVATRSTAKTRKAASQHKCSVCKIPFADPVIRDYHEKVAHTEDNLKPEARIVTLTPLPRTRAGSRMPTVRLKSVRIKSEEKAQCIENVSITPSSEDPLVDQPAPKQATDVRFNVCNYCGYRCKRKSDVRRHIIRVHLADSNPQSHPADLLFCAVCGQSFDQKISLRRHVVRAHFMQPGLKCGQEMSRGYCCDVCGESYLAVKRMLAHRDVLHIDAPSMTWKTLCSCLRKVNPCPQCGRCFARGKFSDEHECVKVDPQVVDSIERAVNAKPRYRCDQCSLCFVWKLVLRQHREVAHPNAEPINWEAVQATDIARYCPSCYLALDGDIQLEDHQCVSSDIDSRPRMHTCDICGSSYVRKSDYQRHQRSKHSDRFPEAGESDSSSAKRKTYISCPYCDQTFGTRNSVLAHIKEAHDIDTDSPFVCVPCNKVFKRKATMDTHNQVYHPKEENAEETSQILKDAEILLNGEAAFHCHICNRNMHNPVRFVAHYRLHFVERKFTCDLCGKQTRTQHQLNSHIKIIHLNIRKYECDLCGKGFHAKQSCEEHRRIHTGERPFSCEICGKTFIAMNALFTHKKFHNDFFAHPCSMCDKKFKVRRSLINHIRTHTGERPFKCELCPKTFNNSSRFSYHKKVTHSDARPFSCAQCGSCFKANKFLMRHMKLHKVRSHIQFRRRNNPAYFAAVGSNGTAKGGQKRPAAEPAGENEKMAVMSGVEYKDEVGAVVCTLQDTFGAESSARLSRNSEHVDAAVDVEESKEFFGDFKAAGGRIDFGSAEGGGSVGVNVKHIRRL